MDMVAADAFVAALETDEGVVEAVGEGGADAVANREDGGAMPTMDLETTQGPEQALERPANNKELSECILRKQLRFPEIALTHPPDTLCAASRHYFVFPKKK